jgi:hypothetical protein
MEEGLEKLFTYLGTTAFRNFGWPAVAAIIVAFFFLRFLLGLAKFAWIRRRQIWERIFPGPNTKKRAKLSIWGLIVLSITSFFLFPSNPIVAVGSLLGLAAITLGLLRDHAPSPALHYAVLAGAVFCTALTIGGILHDVVYPPTALCQDGVYSSSSSRRGTCSWHGGVREWNPGPWWQAIFR